MARLLALLLLLAACVPAVLAQQEDPLLSRFQQARSSTQAQALIDRQGTIAPPRPVVHVPAGRADSLATWIASLYATEEEPSFTVEQWYLVRPLHRAWFYDRFERALWTYTAGEGFADPLDTTRTSRLRGLLQARFGEPSRTTADLMPADVGRRDDYPQFEYNFIVNDSIPVVLMDVNGPRERGLVFASDRAYAGILPVVRRVLARELLAVEAPAPFADYFYDPEADAWYLTGYDGETFYTYPIDRPRLGLQRPAPDDAP